MKLHVDVLQEDIDQGCEADTTGWRGGCMVWRAFQRATEGAFTSDEVRVVYTGIALNGRRIATLPKRVSREIKRFDELQKVEPFDFYIDLSDELLSGALR